MKKIILICGVVGSGKDYYFNLYKRTHPDENVHRLKFSSSLLGFAENEYGIELDTPEKYEEFKLKHRRYLQYKSEEIKQTLGINYFSDVELDKINLMGENDTAIITDFRFPYEIENILNKTNALDTEVYMILCNYHSDRYDDKITHISEMMAQGMIENGFPSGLLINARKSWSRSLYNTMKSKNDYIRAFRELEEAKKLSRDYFELLFERIKEQILCS